MPHSHFWQWVKKKKTTRDGARPMALSVTKSVNGRNQNAATCQFDQDKVRSELSYWLVANPSKYSRKSIPGSAVLAAAIWAAG